MPWTLAETHWCDARRARIRFTFGPIPGLGQITWYFFGKWGRLPWPAKFWGTNSVLKSQRFNGANTQSQPSNEPLPGSLPAYPTDQMQPTIMLTWLPLVLPRSFFARGSLIRLPLLLILRCSSPWPFAAVPPKIKGAYIASIGKKRRVSPPRGGTKPPLLSSSLGVSTSQAPQWPMRRGNRLPARATLRPNSKRAPSPPRRRPLGWRCSTSPERAL